MDADLILVRHAAPQIDAARPAVEWSLSDGGRRGTRALAFDLRRFAPVVLIVSPEPKALQTAAIMSESLALEVRVDHDLVEQRRPGLGFAPRAEFERAIRTIFARPSERFFEGESADEACARLEAGIVRHAERPLAVVTHGTVLSLVVGRRTGQDPFTLWSSLRLPDAFVLDSRNRVVARLPA
jgi:broad specificity phosphatase PhoE